MKVFSLAHDVENLHNDNIYEPSKINSSWHWNYFRAEYLIFPSSL